MKLSQTQAKAIAETAIQRINSDADKRKKDAVKKIESDPEYKKLRVLSSKAKLAYDELSNLEHKIESRYDISISTSYGKVSHSPNRRHHDPYGDFAKQIRREVTLLTIESDKFKTSEDIINHMVKKYSV